MKREAPRRGIVESRLCAQPVEVGKVLRQNGSKQGGLAPAWSALTSLVGLEAIPTAPCMPSADYNMTSAKYLKDALSQIFMWGLFRTSGPRLRI